MKADPYTELEGVFARLTLLGEAEAVLNWDWAVMMPDGGASARSAQIAELKALSHSIITDPLVGDLLDGAESQNGLGPWQAANLREMRRIRAHSTALDENLVVALARDGMACETVWRTAREDGDFKAVLPAFEGLLGLVREKARAKAEKLGLEPYDALLDAYEPGGRAAFIAPLFAGLEAFVPSFLARVLEKQAATPKPLKPRGPFPQDKQRRLGMELMEAIGFDFDHGRLDVSHHPFCGGVPEDVRITTRYDRQDFTSGLMGILHETGHAMYERGLPSEWRSQPVGQARGMSIHESQSLLVEMQVCRGRDFLSFAAPLMARAFGGGGDDALGFENLYRLYTHVEPGFIRVDADEVTYPAHVMLRYRLERAMISGDLEAADLPGAFNDGMEELLGITPPTDREGCLQDIHWFDGTFGYFPTYTLGAVTAAQIFAAAVKARPQIPEAVGKGDFRPLMGWLKENIHAQGSLLESPELIEAATGSPLSLDAFKAHLNERYLG
ncbi:MAG: carboxypeptidase M32 [Rhodospirillales bacterium]